MLTRFYIINTTPFVHPPSMHTIPSERLPLLYTVAPSIPHSLNVPQLVSRSKESRANILYSHHFRVEAEIQRKDWKQRFVLGWARRLYELDRWRSWLQIVMGRVGWSRRREWVRFAGRLCKHIVRTGCRNIKGLYRKVAQKGCVGVYIWAVYEGRLLCFRW
jgi:hypothetical protein